MTSRPADRAKRLVFRTFGALPKTLRLVIIRTIRPSWIAGSVAVIEREDGRWLFVRPVYRKGWALPGGLVDRGEHPATTVVREMKEELGLDVRVVSDGWVIVNSAQGRFETVFRVEFVDDVDPDEIEITTVELSDLGWFDPAEPPMVEDETREVLALARQVAAGGSEVHFRGADHS